MAKHRVYVYGTLRRGSAVTYMVPGVIYDLGYFPGLKKNEAASDATVVCEVLEVDDDQLQAFDRYEGYSEESPESSLYIRERYNDGWIYVYNRDVDPDRIIDSGDWEKHKEATGKRLTASFN